MKVTVTVPVPFDNWSDFEPAISQFTSTWKLHPPGIDDYQLVAVAHWGEPTDAVRQLFYGIRTRWTTYYGGGADLGSHVKVATLSGRSELLVCMSSRCFFHRAGWLKRFVEAREKHGPGIYGTGVFEVRPHIRTCAFAIDSDFLIELPGGIHSRQDTVDVESGSRCLTDFVLKQGGKAVQVLWDEEQEDQTEWRAHYHDGIFRRGRQNAMLVHDRHTDLFDKASTEEKHRLEALANGVA